MQNKSVKKNYIMNIVLSMSSFIFPLIVFPYVARIIKPVGLGKVSMATSVISCLSIFAQLGIPTYGIRECAKVRDDKGRLSQLVCNLLYINTISCFVTFSFFWVLLFFIPQFKYEATLYLIMSSSLILNTFGMEWLFRGLEEYYYITVRSLIFKAIAIVLMFFFIKNENDYILYGFFTVFAASASNILNIFRAHKIISFKGIEKKSLSKHVASALVFVSMTCATTIYMNLDNIMLGFMKDNIEVGYYDAAVKVKKVVVSIITALGGVLLPRVTYLIENNYVKQFKEIVCKSINYVIFIALPMMFYLIYFAQDCIYLLCGEEYEGAVIPMKIITGTIIFIGLSNMTGIQVLIPLGKEKKVLISEIYGAIIDVILNFLLIPLIGASGAAVGTVAAEITVLLVQLYYIREDIRLFFKNAEILKVCVACVVALVSVLYLTHINMTNIGRLIISALQFCMVYFFVLIIERHSMIKMMQRSFFKRRM